MSLGLEVATDVLQHYHYYNVSYEDWDQDLMDLTCYYGMESWVVVLGVETLVPSTKGRERVF